MFSEKRSVENSIEKRFSITPFFRRHLHNVAKITTINSTHRPLNLSRIDALYVHLRIKNIEMMILFLLTYIESINTMILLIFSRQFRDILVLKLIHLHYNSSCYIFEYL